MSKKIAPKDNENNQRNANKGTPGTNKQYDQAHGNRSKQKEESKAGKKK